MTRPIYEPSQQRTDRRLGYFQDQLLRRPPPPAGDTEIPWARRSRPYTSANQSIANASFDAFNVVNDYNMGTGESGADWFHAETAGNADGIIVEQPCFVVITCGIRWFDAIGASWALWVTIDPTVGITRRMFPMFAGQTATDMQGILTMHSRCSTGDIIIAGAWQNAGAARAADSSFFEVGVLGTWTGTTIPNMDPNDIG